MNSAIRWRIVSLQAVMVVVLVGAAIFAFGLGTFTTGQIREELSAQQIYFPSADQTAIVIDDRQTLEASQMHLAGSQGDRRVGPNAGHLAAHG